MRKIIVWKVKCIRNRTLPRHTAIYIILWKWHRDTACSIIIFLQSANYAWAHPWQISASLRVVQNTVNVVSILFSTWILYFHKLIICPWLDQSLRTPIHSPRSISWLICYCGYLHSPCTNHIQHIHQEVSCSQRVYALQNLLIANSLHYSSQCASVSRSTETDASPFILGFFL